MTDTIIMFVHLMAAVVAAGSSVFGLFLLWPRVFSPGRDEPLDENSAPYKIIDLLAPTVFTCLLILIGSGVYYLMENYTEQVNLKEGYYNMLGIKLIFVVAAFLLSLYQTFGLRSKIAHLDLRPENREWVRPTLEKMKYFGGITLGAIVFAVFMGIYLARY
ncbi:MAG: hypothetical protein OEZ51_12520 [Nitrospinota bacterium]|nr:hypothetical protein [Nitrospinota bacterium]